MLNFPALTETVLAEILRDADGESGVIAVSFYIGQRRVDRNERKIRPVYVFTEVMLVLHIDVEALPKAKFLCIHLKESVELTAVAPSLAAIAFGLSLIELRDPDVGHDTDAPQLLFRTVGSVGQGRLVEHCQFGVLRGRHAHRRSEKGRNGQDRGYIGEGARLAE